MVLLTNQRALTWTFDDDDDAPEGVSKRSVTGLAIDEDGNRILAGTQTSRAFLLTPEAANEAAKIWTLETDGPVNDVAVSTSGNRPAVGTAAGSIYLLTGDGP